MRYECLKISVNYEKADAHQVGGQPVLQAWLLEKSPELLQNNKRPAVIVCPGGGYAYRSGREGEPIAMRFLAGGMHAFVLQYSVAPSRYPSAALELAAAVKLVRENAENFGILTDQIYIAGFSAGGHLCATLGTLWEEPVFEKALGGKGGDWRPNGMILCYPVITMGEYTHQGSRDCLLGPDACAEIIDALSLEKRVSAKTVPAFLWHTYEDGAVPAENSLLFALALKRFCVPFELHVYEKGGHGLALCDITTAQGSEHLVPDNAGWMDLAIRWIWRKAGMVDHQ